MQAEEKQQQQQRPPALPLLPPLGEVAALGAARGVRWRRLPRLTEGQLREQLLLLEEEEEEEGKGRETVPLHARLEGRLVPTSSPPYLASSSAAAAAAAAARLDRAHAAVIDNFVSEEARAELLSLVVFGSVEGERGGRGSYDELSGGEGLPRPRWERRTADSDAAVQGEEEEDASDGGGGTGKKRRRRRRRHRRRLGWGLSSRAIEDLLSSASSDSPDPPPRAFAEMGSKLGAMFSEHDCLWLPTESMEGTNDGGGGGEPPPSRSSTSPPLLANAAAASDSFSYHVDCDPDSTRTRTPWLDAFGHFVNGEPDRPLLVSLVLYLNSSWLPSFAGETLLADSTAGVGCAVLPRPRRALLMESDVLHKVCPQSLRAGNRLRFSLVLKLALCPKRRGRNDGGGENVNVLSREWWGPPADLGSAKALSELVRKVGEEKRERKRGGGGGGGGGKEGDGGDGGEGKGKRGKK